MLFPRQRPTIVVTGGILHRRGKFLVARRRKGSHLEGCWEFPGGKLEAEESPDECLVRELAEEIGVRVQPHRALDVVFHRYPNECVLLVFYYCELVEGEPQAVDCDAVSWVSREELASLDWAPADRAFVRRLIAGAYQFPG